MITLAVLTSDGRRDVVAATLESAGAALVGEVHRRVVFTDDDAGYVEWLTALLPGWEVVTTGPKAGYGPAMAAAWEWLRFRVGVDDHVFWLEDDFTFNRPVDLPLMAEVLVRNRNLAQLALRRQPWNEAERDAGGVVEQHPDWYEDRRDAGLDAEWLEHGAYWTDNPSLAAGWVFRTAWPAGRGSEGLYTFRLKDDHPHVRFGYWGARSSGEAVTHTGDVRVGAAY